MSVKRFGEGVSITRSDNPDNLEMTYKLIIPYGEMDKISEIPKIDNTRISGILFYLAEVVKSIENVYNKNNEPTESIARTTAGNRGFVRQFFIQAARFWRALPFRISKK